jgi:predicted negative regulator of RcsB-dependent stress response
MKAEHRHGLQTNWLAKRLDVAIQQLRPYVSTVAGVIIAVAVLMMIWSYVSKSKFAQQGDAWNAYNQAVGSLPPSLEKLHQSAQEYPGTKMQELADITWADGQVFNASQSFIYNRRAATDALNRATSAYQGVLQTSSDERLINRAHLGMARIYEMRNELDKARDEYLKVGGGYADYAKQQAERLAKPEAKDTYAWLEKAQPPLVAPPMGPGTPGRRPAFSAGDLSLPGATPEAGTPGATTEPGPNFDELLKGLRELPSETGDRYEGEEQAPPVNSDLPGTPATDGTAPATEPAPATESSAPATNDGSSTESDTTPPSDTNTAAPVTETNTTEEKSTE